MGKKEKATNSGKNPKKSGGLWRSKTLGFFFAAIQAIVTCVFAALLLYLDIVPAKILIPVIFLLVLFLGYDIFSQFSKKFRTSGKIIAIIVTIVLIIGSFLLLKTNQLFKGISGSNTKTDVIAVYVLKDDPAQTLGDVADYQFGILSTIDRENTDNTVSKINTTVGKEIAITEYNDMISLADALLNGEVQTIILNSAFVDTIADDDEHLNFAELIREVESVSYTTVIEDTGVSNVTTDPFTIYISGIDVYGDISTTSRSDVNILATINPKTKQVALISTPRDYYVQTTVSGGAYDKLTHAGIYGVDCSMGTLAALYDLDVQYYFRVNFTGFEKVIDALGGVTVDSDFAFTTYHGGYAIQQGLNEMDGKKALGFARERYAFSDGDRQRGRNQMKVIKAVIDKASSPAVINNFSALVDSVSGSFETNLSSDEISSLIKMEINDMASWNVVQYSVNGFGDSKTTYSAPNSHAYVMQPDESTVEVAKQLQQQVLRGETISDPATAPAGDTN